MKLEDPKESNVVESAKAAAPDLPSEKRPGCESELLPGLIWRRLAPRFGWDASLPDLGSFEQKRLRRWRARI